MLRHCATCARCGQISAWNGNRGASLQEIVRHLKSAHQVQSPAGGADYHMCHERQCDLCLEPYLDDCTKCRRDFCREYAGDIDGLCGCCI